MPSLAAIESEIEKLAARRHAIWSGAHDKPGEVARIARKLSDLYEERRMAQARLRTGGRTHAEIVRQARVESELERLMTR